MIETLPADLQHYLARFEAATADFLNGDPTEWLRLASRRDQATVMGAWGACERGWAEVEPRYRWAAARFRPVGARPTFEYLAATTSGDLCCTVAIERSRVLVIGEMVPSSMQLRVTHVHRREADGWRMLHRHADALNGRIAPAAVLQ